MARIGSLVSRNKYYSRKVQCAARSFGDKVCTRVAVSSANIADVLLEFEAGKVKDRTAGTQSKYLAKCTSRGDKSRQKPEKGAVQIYVSFELRMKRTTGQAAMPLRAVVHTNGIIVEQGSPLSWLPQARFKMGTLYADPPDSALLAGKVRRRTGALNVEDGQDGRM